MTYPIEMRRHILETKEKEKLSIRKTAKRFNVGKKTIDRWLVEIEPKTTRNKPCSKIDMDALKKDVEDRPDDYQYERAERFGVSQSAIFAALKRLGMSRKKNTKAS
jgi:transposase